MALVVIAYDISNDRRRVNLHKLLREFGVAVQESVFECGLEESALRRLRPRIRNIVRPGDRVRIYALCGACAERIEDGTGSKPAAAPDVYVL